MRNYRLLLTLLLFSGLFIGGCSKSSNSPDTFFGTFTGEFTVNNTKYPGTLVVARTSTTKYKVTPNAQGITLPTKEYTATQQQLDEFENIAPEDVGVRFYLNSPAENGTAFGDLSLFYDSDIELRSMQAILKNSYNFVGKK